MAGMSALSDPMVIPAAVKPAPTAASVNDALATLVQEHAGFAFRIAYGVLRNHHDAEDAVQEAFLRVLRFQKQLENVADPKAWLAKIVWRTAIDRVRISRPDSLDEFEPVDSRASAEALAATAQMQRIMSELIAGLPPDLRGPIVLGALEELSSAQVGQVLGIPEGSVRTRQMRARQLLKEKLIARLGDRHAG
jgi:RNA polymerase sigma-70 factor (ECF subfamily)